MNDLTQINAACLKNAFIASLLKSVQIEKYINKVKEKFCIADLESDLTVIYREELKKPKANQKFIAIKGALIFANETTLHTFLKEIAEVFLINISINNSVISSEVENVLDWDIKIQNNNISVPNICLNYAYLLNKVYKCDEMQKEEEEEEQMSQFDYNPPSDTNQSHGKTINMCLSKEENMKIINEERHKKNDEEQDNVNKGKITPLKINIKEISKTPSENNTKLKEQSRKRCHTLNQESDTKKYGFYIEGSDPSDFLKYLDKHTTDSFKSMLDFLNENIPKIHNSLVALKSYTKGIDKILKKIPYQMNQKTNEIILKCRCCILHCPQNWNMSSPPGHPTGNSIKKKKI